MKTIAILTTILAVFVWVDAAWAEIINVPDDFETIQGGIDEAEDDYESLSILKQSHQRLSRSSSTAA